MTIRTATRRGNRRLIIDIHYTDTEGRNRRHRRDAQVQTMAAARAEERRLLSQLGQTGNLATSKPTQETPTESYTLADGIACFRRTRALQLKPSTRDGYDELLDSFIEDRGLPLTMSSVARLAEELDVRLATESIGLSRRRNLQVAIRAVCQASVSHGLLPAMPAFQRLHKIPASVLEAPSRDELAKIMAAARAEHRITFGLAAWAGLRTGEIVALRPCDVKLTRGLLSVRRSAYRGIEQPTKSGDQRQVPIASPLIELLRPALKAVDAPWGPFIMNAHGRPWGASGPGQALRRACQRAGTPRWTMHHLRHFFVTETIKGGGSLRAVQEMVGHRDLATTQRYAHVTLADRRAAISTFDGNLTVTAPLASDLT